MPSDLKKLLSEACPYEFWIEAQKQAKRSTIHSYGTGSVIFNHKTNEMIGRGTSHHSDSDMTVHAEEHALRNSYGERNYGEKRHKGYDLSIIIVTARQNGNWSWSSCPCISCATKLLNSDIRLVHYAERTEDEWIVRTETPGGLLNRVKDAEIRRTMMANNYARDMRIKR